MKYAILISFTYLACLMACNSSSGEHQMLQSRIDSLRLELATSYKPGLGEFMSQIQVHHAKLWFAGQNQNWELADFETGEINEAIAGIMKYCSARQETTEITMIEPPLDSLNMAIQHKDLAGFNNKYHLLTNTCNHCHQETNHAFNVITIPLNPPYSNQNFKPIPH